MPKNKRELLFSVTAKDCRWDYYRGSGSGGQKKNKTSSAVRCTHIDSKAVGQSEDGRSQSHNKKTAFKRMVDTDKFDRWVKVEFSRQSGALKAAEEATERLMHPNNIRVEIKENGKWKIVDPKDIPEDILEDICDEN